jgi:hypothetical protein
MAMRVRTGTEQPRPDEAVLELVGPPRDGPLPPVSMQRRVQFTVLLQFLENGSASRGTTRAVCPGTDARDLESALEHLVLDGSLAGPTWRLATLVELAENGGLTLTALGRLRLDEDDV